MLLVALLGPVVALVLAALLGLLQWSIYALLVRSGLIDRERIPFFGMLLFRGLLLVLAGTLVIAIMVKTEVPFWEDPALSEDKAEYYKQLLQGDAAADDAQPDRPPSPIEQNQPTPDPHTTPVGD